MSLSLSGLFSLFLILLAPSYGLNLDGTLLLSFKYSVLSDPLSVLDNWDYSDATPCSWTGVTCAYVGSPFAVIDYFRVVTLSLPNRQLLGIVPEELGLIPHLRTLDLSNNFLNGTLPKSLFHSPEIQIVSLANNVISGVIPELVPGPKSLKLLNLSDNALAGNIPKSMSSLQNLTTVSLRSNYISGPIPGGFQFLQELDLSSNLLNGTLPLDFGGENLKYLNLSSNKLSGLVPGEFAAKIPANAAIDLSFNNLSGEVPETTSLSNQKTEYYAGNVELCGKPLRKLCSIPSTLSNPPNASLNSSSPAIAAIPKTIEPNSPTAAGGGEATPAAADMSSQHDLKPGAIAGIAVGPLAAIGVLAAVFLYIHQKKKRAHGATKETSSTTINAYEFKKDSEPAVVKDTRSLPTWPCLSITNGEETSEATGSDSDENGNSGGADRHAPENHGHPNPIEQFKKERSLVMVDGETELELETLFKASAYVLCSSGSTIVYKAVLQDGTAFAVRRIGECGVERLKEFENQVRAVAKMRHGNLVRVRGFYWGDDEKLVIYDYVSNGSLANVGYRKMGASPYHLPFEARLKIAKGVARGLAYIHDKKNVHGNIKPSNVLLTPDMEPAISDFGLHWLVHGKHSRKADGTVRHFGSKRSSTSRDDLHDQSVSSNPYIAPVGFVGCTSPYHAPESLNNLKPNPKWDVYSFGILLLELLTGKVFSDRELSQWTAGSVAEDPSRVLRMADVAIRGDVVGREEAVVAWFKLGFSCASLAPQKRPSMKDALHVLEKIPCRSQ